MKTCSYCGNQYPDEATVCPSDGQQLGEPVASEQKSSGASAAGVVCPACGASDGYTPVVELRGSFSWPLFFIGGFLAVLFRNAGRSRKVRCNKCEAIFDIRPRFSTAFRVALWLLVATGLIVLIIWLVGLAVAAFSH